jgi:predicted RNase H-like nuclease
MHVYDVDAHICTYVHMYVHVYARICNFMCAYAARGTCMIPKTLQNLCVNHDKQAQ